MSNVLYSQLFDLIKKSGSLFVESYENSKSKAFNFTGDLFICGMGGSAISGDYISALNKQQKTIQSVILIRSYEFPDSINKDSNVIIISYSGNTEEALFLIEQALSMDIHPYVITSGGLLAEIAKNNKLSLIQVEKNFQPRAAFPLLFGSLYGLVASSLRLMSLESIRQEIIQKSSTVFQDHDLLGEIAEVVCRFFPIIVSADELAPVATRFRCQLNENSKLPAASFIVPEFSHNAIVAFDGEKAKNLVLITLRSSIEHKRVKIHLDHITNHVGKNAVSVFEMKSTQDTYLEQLLDLTWKLDYISILAAKHQNIDPMKVPSINSLKKRLNEEKK